MRRLLNFSITSMDDIEQKGNLRYIEHYLAYFDEYIGVYVWGSHQREQTFGNATVVCVGAGRGGRDLLKSPWRVYREARQRSATHFLTADLIYGWWHALFLKLFLRAKIVVMPVCTPPEILKNTGQTYSGFSPWIEKQLINLTFALSERILVTHSSLPDQRWVNSLWCRKKMRIGKVTPEELPSPEFLMTLKQLGDKTGALREHKPEPLVRLVYVGRLEREKFAQDLIKVAAILKNNGLDFELTLIGDGTARAELEKDAFVHGVAKRVKFLGFLNAREVAMELAQNDIFLSTLTGTALKEAALARLAIVAYGIDFIPDVYTHGENCMLTLNASATEMAAHILALVRDRNLCQKIAKNAFNFTQEQWSPEAVRTSLEGIFGDI